jgi:hypothetical protein
MQQIRYNTVEFINKDLSSGGYPTKREIVPKSAFLNGENLNVCALQPHCFTVVNDKVWMPVCFIMSPVNDKLYHLMVRYDNDNLASDVFAGDILNGDLSLEPTYRYYSTGILASDLNIGTNEIACLIHDKLVDDNIQPYQINDYVVLSAIVDGSNTHREIAKIINVVYDSNTVTITIDRPLTKSFLAQIEIDGAGNYTSITGVSSGYLLDENIDINHPVKPVAIKQLGDNRLNVDLIQLDDGCVYDYWTIQIMTGGTFKCSGTRLENKNLPVGRIGQSYAPIVDGGKPVFTIPSTAWSGNILNGNIFSFTTKPCYTTFFLVTGVYNDDIDNLQVNCNPSVHYSSNV